MTLLSSASSDSFTGILIFINMSNMPDVAVAVAAPVAYIKHKCVNERYDIMKYFNIEYEL